MNCRVLLVGSLPPPVGGATVLFRQLTKDLAEVPGVLPIVVDTGRVRRQGLATFPRLLGTIREMNRGTRDADVLTLHVSATGVSTLGPILVLLSKRSRKPLIIRLFGGRNIFSEPGPSPSFSRRILSQATLVLVETRELLEAAAAAGMTRVGWYPNGRKMNEVPARYGGATRFVFLSQVRTDKGVPEMLAAASRLPNGASLDVYGPLVGDVTTALFEGQRNIRYLGPLAPDDVYKTLFEYDVLILPTYYAGEGYPGVVLEAFACGLPVIATRWRRIPEVVDDSCGILIEPRSSDELLAAMSRLGDAELMSRLRSGVLRRREAFRSEKLAADFATMCRELCTRERADEPSGGGP